MSNPATPNPAIPGPAMPGPGFSIDIPPGPRPPRHAVVAESDPALRAALAAALGRCRFTVAATADPMAALALLSEADTALALFSRGRGPDDGGERAAALAVALSPRTRILLTAAHDAPAHDAPCDDDTGAGAGAGADAAGGDPFPILPLTADPVRLAARLCRWLAATPLAA